MRLSAIVWPAALLGLLAGCASPPGGVPEQAVVTSVIAPATWRAVDREIEEGSRSARADAEAYALIAVRHWANRIWEQTEKGFIPWYADYWTQQWLSLKLAWYQANEENDGIAAAERLAILLEEEFYTRVVEPVAQETTPGGIEDGAAAVYIKGLASRIESIPDQYRIPLAVFNARLAEITAIDLSSTPPRVASLHQLVTADELAAVSAYQALKTYQRRPGSRIETGAARNRLDAVARQAADKAAEKIALRSGGAAAAALAGGGFGILISAGVTAWGIAEHQKERPALERALRETLMSALQETSRILLDDRHQGVLAATYHISAQLEGQLEGTPRPGRSPEQGPSEHSETFDALF